jgi:YegS/Rv2252/BmrU family lipid kinase
MKNVRLLYNPRSGGKRRHAQMDAALAMLKEAGMDASVVVTQSSAEATLEAHKAVGAGCDTVFACGGDGTIHDVIQGLARTPVALAILPLGTANALAHDLRLPSSPVAATRAALTANPRRIALGHVVYLDLAGATASCYFTVAAGVGVDAHLFYKLHSGMKQRLGMGAYYAKAWHLWMTHRMRKFAVEYREPGETSETSTSGANVTELLAVRIRNFGGVLKELAPGASLERNDVRLVLCRSSSRAAYLHYITRGLVGARWRISGIDLVHAERVTCFLDPSRANDGERIYIEADGELLGTIPAEITMVPDALTLLAP